MDDLLDFSSDTYFMGEALRQARKAESQDEVPIGAVIVRNAEIIARAWNQVEILKDATAHAEMLAITQAESVVGDWRLDDCDLYVTKEPCPMCAGAIVQARTPAHDLWMPGSENWWGGRHDQSAANASVESPMRNHTWGARD